MATGMFDSMLRGLRQDEQDEEQQLQFLAQDPTRATAHTAYSGAAMAGKGLGRAVAGMAGKDVRTPEERMRGAMTAMGEIEEGDMATPAGVDAYYKRVMDTLRQHGLPGEAHAAAQEWHKQKNEQADRQVKLDEIARKRAEGERNAAIKEEANRIKALRTKQLGEQGLPEFVQLVDRAEQMAPGPFRTAFMDRINQQAGGKIKLEEAGDRIIVRNERGDILGIDEMGAKPLTEQERLKAAEAKKELAPAYESSMLTAQTQYKAAADLYNSPGLDELIGKWTGLAAEYGENNGMLPPTAVAALGPEAREALGIYQQIMGGAFIEALRSLKKAGGGSTGLGQVTEVEGKKITQAAGALFPRQQPASFRRKLADYISTIEQSADILGRAAKADGLAPIGLNIVELTGPTRGKPGPVAPTAPRRPTPTQQSTGDTVTMRKQGKDGKTITRNVRRSMVEEAKRRGYMETQ